MKYISLDLETTSLTPHVNNILQISMILEDTQNVKPLTELPHFTVYVSPGIIQGDAVALNMNAKILKILAENDQSKYKILSTGDMLVQARDFIDLHFGGKRATVAGKCVGTFDLLFFRNTILEKKFHRRIIEPTIMYTDWTNDDLPPGLSVCKQRAGLSEGVSHDAWEDAADVIQLLRPFYCNIGS